jgi:hypothetical protein
VIESGTQVLFGGAAARVVEAESDEIKVLTPPGPTGRVEVLVVTRGQVVARGWFQYF